MRIDKSIVSGKAKNLSVYVASVKSEINNLKSLTKEIDNSWKGKKGTDFINSLDNSYITELEKLEAILEDYNDFLSKVPRAYEMLDEEYGNKNINV